MPCPGRLKRFLIVSLSLITFLPQPAQAADLEETALNLAPQDAAFFMTSLDMKEEFTALAEGPFVAKVRAVPFVQQLESEFMTQWEDPQGPLKQGKMWLKNPNVINLLQLMEEMFSEEFFVYGGGDWCDAIEGMMAFQQEVVTNMNGGPEAMEAYFAKLTREDVSRIRIPTTVMGFRIEDDENAKLQLDALEGFMRLGGAAFEPARPFLQRLKRAELDDGQTLTIQLDTDLIPLDSIYGEEREVAEKVIELLEGRSLYLAMGVRSNMLVMAFGEGDSAIESLGESGDKLLDHEVMEVLRDAELENLRSISYASGRWMESQFQANFGHYFRNIMMQIKAGMRSSGNLSEEEIEELMSELDKDAEFMDSKIDEMVPEFGPVLGWARATETGSEGYSYNWTRNVSFENAAPLSILDHAGVSPLMLFGFKGASTPVAEELMAHLLDRVPYHFKRIVNATVDADEKEEILAVMDEAWPLVTETFRILHEKISPALADNESVFSMEGSWMVNELPDMPTPNQPLPLPEMALACKLTDRALFLEGCTDLFEVADQVVELIREHDTDAIPPGYSIPRPQEDSMDGATKYSYAEFTEAVPLAGFEPQLVVSDEALVLGYSQRQVEGMVAARELDTRPAWMTDETPTAAMSYIDMAGMVAAARPWVEYALSVQGRELDEPVADEPGPVPTGNDILQIWDCLSSMGKAASSVTIEEDGVTVSRWVWVSE